MRTHDPVEIVTIGAGLTASILAARILPGTSHRMVSIEQGPAQWTYPDFAHNHDELRYAVRYAMMQDLGKSTWTWRPHAQAPALPMRQYANGPNLGHGLGGSAAHWSAVIHRYLPMDFSYRTRLEERYGAERIPPDMTVRDWPIGYDDLEPYYDAFEYDVGASGAAGNLAGRILPEGNPFEGPRRRPFPNPPLPVTAFGTLFDEASGGLGLHPYVNPSAILSRGYTDPYGNVRAGCLYCGFCTQYGCEVGAKTSPLTTWLPPSLATGRYEVRTDSHVLGIETADDGRATGVQYVDQHGREHFQPAEAVVTSAWTFENVRHLLLARSTAHPEGIGNDQGMVGRNYTYQLQVTGAQGLWEDRRFNLYTGNGATVPRLFDYYGDVFEHTDLDFVGGALLQPDSGERTPVGSVGGLLTGLTDRQWGAEWKQTLAQTWDGVGGVWVQGESPAYAGNVLDLDPTYTDTWGRPLLRITFDWTDNERAMFRFMSARCEEIVTAMGPDRMTVTRELPAFSLSDGASDHIQGGAIMGTDPGNSVTNSYGQVWDTPNVFVAGAALFPQNPAAHPTETAAALTYRAADAIRDRYFAAPGELLT